MVLSVRSLLAMASIVRSSVQTRSSTEQVAEPSDDRAMRFNRSPEQQSTILTVHSNSFLYLQFQFFLPQRPQLTGLHPPT